MVGATARNGKNTPAAGGSANRMRVLVPCGDPAQADRLIQAGADELYLGFFDDGWVGRFGESADLNRMSGFGSLANKASFEDVLTACDQVSSRGGHLFVTLNASTYTPDELDFIRDRYLPRLAKRGVSGVIVSSIKLGSLALDAGVVPVASTMCAIYNADIARVYQNAGFRRMIVPRDLSLEEIGAIHEAVPDVELEAFFLRNGCMFSDGYCLGLHRPECGALCTFIRTRPAQVMTDYAGFDAVQAVELNSQMYDRLYHTLYACGLCALWRLRACGVTSLKVVGRADNLDAVCSDVRLTTDNLRIMEACSSEEEYLDRMRLPSNAPSACLLGLSCYYPEVRFGS